jgi:protein-disulfide isomerase
LKIHLPSVGIGVGAVIGIAFVVLLLGHAFEKPATQIPGTSFTVTPAQGNMTQASVNFLVDNTSPILGSKDAPITMIEFGDYQCFYCNKFYHTIEPDIVKNYINTGKVRMVFKDFVIIGQDSVNAAHAAHCAQEQGKFWEYHDALYDNWAGENTGWASSNNLTSFATKVGLNGTQFSNCMSQSRYLPMIQGSMSDAKGLGLTGTPDFFIVAPDHSITKIVGAQPYEVFDNLFKSKLNS